MIRIDAQINAVTRRVDDATLEAGQGRVATLTQTYATDIDDLWQACTDPDRIARWFAPVSGELREGGTFQVEGNAGGTIERCEAPKHFSVTWEFDGALSWIDVTLTAEGAERTRFELAHTMPVDDHWERFGPGATGIGWDLALLGLGTHLSTPAEFGPGAAEKWVAGEEGKRFMTLAGQRWRNADIAAGEHPERSRRRAEQTISFYTGAENG